MEAAWKQLVATEAAVSFLVESQGSLQPDSLF